MLRIASLLAFIALASFSAKAADIISPANYNWTGAYVGVSAGGGWGSTHPTYGGGSTATVDMSGGIAGVDAGYDWQSNSIVYGVVFDGSWAGIKGSEVGPNTPCVISGIGCTASVDWLATGRARLGVSTGRLLPYVTGGLAMGGLQGTFDSPNLACTCSASSVQLGWTAGAGIEYAINDKFTAKLEYLYTDLGRPTIQGDNTLNAPFPGVGTGDYTFSVVRLGLNLRF